jgi:hypothetical protein
MTFISLNERLVDAYPDPELRRLAPGLSVAVEFRVGGQSIGLSVVDGRLFKGFTGEPTMRIEGERVVYSAGCHLPQLYSAADCQPGI